MEIEVDVTWKAKSGNEYEIPVTITLVKDSDYGSDYDGNRGTPILFCDEVFCGDDPIDDIGMTEEDAEEFSLDLIEDRAIELAVDSLSY